MDANDKQDLLSRHNYHSIDHLVREIEFVKPSVVIAFGRLAFNGALLTKRKKNSEFEILPLGHPSRTRYTKDQVNAFCGTLLKAIGQKDNAANQKINVN